MRTGVVVMMNKVCCICGLSFKQITNTHLAHHQITIKEYLQQHPEAGKDVKNKTSRVRGCQPWNKGLDISDSRVLRNILHSAQTKRELYKQGKLNFKQGSGWNRGLTKDTDERVYKNYIYAQKAKQGCLTVRGIRQQQKRVNACLTLIENILTVRPCACGCSLFVFGKRYIKEHEYYQNNSHTPNWNNGSSFLPYDSQFNPYTKRLIAKRDNYICQLCFVASTSCVVHHIDKNRHNSNTNNLIYLCRPCHGKVHAPTNEQRFQQVLEVRFHL